VDDRGGADLAATVGFGCLDSAKLFVPPLDGPIQNG
jgi:hypothetical protein